MSQQKHAKRAKRLKPTGHSALIESMIQPAIVIGSTLMSAIAAYVLALDELTRILSRHGAPSDYFIVALCAGMGFLIDMAIIVSATRYKMHAVRNDPREKRWLRLAQWVLAIGLASETMTLFYFFVHLSARAFPLPLVQLADWIHSVLAASRSFLPPIVIAYFAAGVLPVMFDRADRNREIKSRTSANIMLLIDRLSEVFDTDDKAEMLRALGRQLMLDTYATYDETGRTTEDAQLKRDAKLLTHLARIHRLDWSEIAADIAPELSGAPQVTANTPEMPAPSQDVPGASSAPSEEPPSEPPPSGPGTPIQQPADEPEEGSEQNGVITPTPPSAPNVVPLTPVRPRAPRRKVARNRGPRLSVEQKARASFRHGISASELARTAHIGKSAASKWRGILQGEADQAQEADQQEQSDQAAQ